MKTSTKAHLAVLCTNLFFAANYSLIKTISPELISPFALNIFRVGLSLLLFWGIWLFGRTSAVINKKDIGRFVLWVLKENFTFSKAAGLALGIGGSVLLILQKETGQHASNYLLGDLFILINAFSYAI